MTTTPLMSLLEKYMDLTSSRHSLITTNMANVDTPGYQTRDIDFNSELRRAMSGFGASSGPVVRNVSGLIERPDGNNVNPDRENVMLAETQIQYKMGIQLMRQEFHRLMTAIKEGNNQ
jgi:flagellar basal-body rod protein FlgB